MSSVTVSARRVAAVLTLCLAAGLGATACGAQSEQATPAALPQHAAASAAPAGATATGATTPTASGTTAAASADGTEGAPAPGRPADPSSARSAAASSTRAGASTPAASVTPAPGEPAPGTRVTGPDRPLYDGPAPIGDQPLTVSGRTVMLWAGSSAASFDLPFEARALTLARPTGTVFHRTYRGAAFDTHGALHLLTVTAHYSAPARSDAFGIDSVDVVSDVTLHEDPFFPAALTVTTGATRQLIVLDPTGRLIARDILGTEASPRLGDAATVATGLSGSVMTTVAAAGRPQLLVVGASAAQLVDPLSNKVVPLTVEGGLPGTPIGITQDGAGQLSLWGAGGEERTYTLTGTTLRSGS